MTFLLDLETARRGRRARKDPEGVAKTALIEARKVNRPVP
jgi:hypothetical protein